MFISRSFTAAAWAIVLDFRISVSLVILFSVAAPVISTEKDNEAFAPFISIRTSELDSYTGFVVNV